MAEEEVIAPSASPLPSDGKRKFEDLDSEPTESNAKSNPNDSNGDAVVSDDGENKRPRLDDDLASANANGHQEDQAHAREPAEETVEKVDLESAVVTEDGEPAEPKNDSDVAASEQASGEVAEPAEAREEPAEVQEVPVEDGHEKAEEPPKETEEPAKDSAEQDATAGDKEPVSFDNAAEKVEIPSDKQDASPGQNQLTYATDTETTTRKIDVPNNKVGVLIGKAGDTIKYLQYNSGAKIQITRDAEADPQAATRSVELIGSSESIDKAERLISAVIAEADAGGSPALVARGLSPAQATVGSEQIQIQVPNEKVGLIIGRGGETIKGLQTKSGARIQVLIPQHLPEGDDSKERTVQVTGDSRQIEIAQELIKEVMSQIWLLPFSLGQHCFVDVA
ncbi:hypothetical protein PIB30_007966 [Stylosanthes scabra]|uniref:K Homology domain-containing protein n=1 Tax=Stylosanthes scabra TaxID=79078 RepID=A0ABU6T636_9FABA|nr:hypothetical protein [Stylosanthes scabra]